MTSPRDLHEPVNDEHQNENETRREGGWRSVGALIAPTVKSVIVGAALRGLISEETAGAMVNTDWLRGA